MHNKPQRLMDDIIIRPAVAADLEAAVPLIYSSGPLVWDCLMGDGSAESALPYLTAAWSSGLGLAGYSVHWVLESPDGVVATVSVLSRAEYWRADRQMARQVLQYFGWRLPARLPRLLRISRKLLPPPNTGSDYLANLGVAEAYRGRGFGRALLCFFAERAAARGQRFLELDVALNNPRAEALYRAVGMQQISEQHDPYFAAKGVPAARRLSLPLGAA